MDVLLQDLQIGWRGIARRPAFAAAVVLTLALAIGVNTAMFSVVNAVLLRPLPFPHPERLLLLFQANDRDPVLKGLASDPNFRDWQSAKSFEAMASYRGSKLALSGNGDPEVVEGRRISEDFFRVLGAPMLLGRALSRAEIAPDAPGRVVISDDFWRSRYQRSSDVLGRVLTINGKGHEIVGVAGAGFDFPDHSQLWINDGINHEECGRGCVLFNVIGRLAPGVTPAQASAELATITRRIQQSDPGETERLVVNLESLEENTVGNVRRGLWVLVGAVGIVLLIACANVANLLFSAAASRRVEIAVRTSLGASARRLLRQLLTESLLLSLFGAALGTLLAHFTVQALGAWAGRSIPRFEGAHIDGAVLGFTMLVMLAAALLFGLAPAIWLARTDAGRALTSARGTVGGGRRTLFGRALLITAQVALSIMLLIGTGLLLRTLYALNSVDLGFKTDRVETALITLPPSKYPEPAQVVRAFAELQRRVAQLPGVESVGGIAGAPLGTLGYGSSFQPLDRPETPTGDKPSAAFRPTLPGYFETLGIPLLRGRTFTTEDTYERPHVAIVGRALAERVWPGEDPVGKQIAMDGSAGFDEDQPRTIVGVVGDVRALDLKNVSDRELYIPHAQSGSANLSFLIRTRPGTPTVLPQLKEQLRAIDPDVPFRSQGRLSDDVDLQLATPTFYSTLLALFAGLALVLSAVGLYGVVSYQMSLRRREVGVRIALGARLPAVVRLIAWQGMRPAVIGIVLGIAGAAASVKIMRALLYNTSTTDLVTWSAVIVSVVLVAGVASLLPALRAARVTPAEALRAD